MFSRMGSAATNSRNKKTRPASPAAKTPGEGPTSTPGRPRSSRSHDAILSAALELLESEGYRRVTIEAIAAQAGVGKQTIYRWWSSKADIVLEAFARAGGTQVPEPDTGALNSDLRAFVRSTLRAVKSHERVLCTLMAEAQLDGEFADKLRTVLIGSRRASLLRVFDRAAARGDLAEQLDRELLVDLVYGPMWYRLLNKHAPVGRALADQLVGIVMAVVRQGDQAHDGTAPRG